ncbi:MAG: hypothetical protein JXB23_09520 [Candidatus Aminicenantes bacterium]|nr:hypothetical protein [Candidatus Aminicenantes bacterium]
MLSERWLRRLCAFLFSLICCVAGARLVCAADDVVSRDSMKNDALKVFVDCGWCDIDYIRTEITFVNYVRDRMDADVHILITEQRTGSGGHEFTLEFIGRKQYSAIRHSLKCVSDRTDTWDEVRMEMVAVLKRGLFPYVMCSPIAEHIQIEFQEDLAPTAVEDKWNFWVFNAGLRGSFDGEKLRSHRSIRSNISANRVTPELKLRLGISAAFDDDDYEIDGEKIVSKSSEKEIRAMCVKSLNDHWSVGGWAEVEAATYGNYDLQVNVAPAFEFNLFPYFESTKRQLRFLYRLHYYYNNYIETTIFDKLSETLWRQSLRTTLEVRQPWGNGWIALEGSHYFHDFGKYRIELHGHLSIRVVRGLNLDVYGRYSRIHDQLNLAKGVATIDEILLERRELATGYDYTISLGLSYTFGSVYSNVVNPRFGD